MTKNILITGVPGIGKTTLVERLITRLEDFHPSGFFTKEIREKGERVGFSLQIIGDGELVLSHKAITGKYRVGRYGVNVDGFEKALIKLHLTDQTSKLAIIDEIGKMECLSERFRHMMGMVLDGQTRVVATVALKGGGFIDAVKKRRDATLIEVTRENRDGLVEKIEKIVRQHEPMIGPEID